MAATLISKVLTAFVAGHSYSRRFFWFPLAPCSASPQLSPPVLRASSSSTAAVDATSPEPVKVKKDSRAIKNLLACPICYKPLTWNEDSGLSIESTSRSGLHCPTCKKTYFGNEILVDLTVANDAKEYGEALPASTRIFSTPLVSFLYERGWRQNFVWGGFPGPEKEFELAKGYFDPVLGGNIVDLSCGSGLFSRLFANSGLFSCVIAMDFSENMLRQCSEFMKQDESFPYEDIFLVKADISRLPFISSSIDAVHAGAALHCWPTPSTAVAEISRILRPGGVFVATTFIIDGLFSMLPLLGTMSKGSKRFSGINTFLSESELEDLCRACGLVEFSCLRNGRFVMISARKPS